MISLTVAAGLVAGLVVAEVVTGSLLLWLEFHGHFDSTPEIVMAVVVVFGLPVAYAWEVVPGDLGRRLLIPDRERGVRR